MHTDLTHKLNKSSTEYTVLITSSKMLHCMTNFATYHEKCTTKITKEQKYTMSLFLYKVSLSNYIKIYLQHIMY